MKLRAVLALPLLLAACGDSGGGAGGGGTGGASSSQTGAGGSDVEAPVSCDILAGVVGSYTVTGEPTGNEQREASTAAHQRETILVGADYAVDFDTGIAFAPSELVTCYDRLDQDFDRRIQVSYGADDNGPVVNFYMATGDVVDEVQFRHRDESINIRALVQKD